MNHQVTRNIPSAGIRHRRHTFAHPIKEMGSSTTLATIDSSTRLTTSPLPDYLILVCEELSEIGILSRDYG